MNKLKTESRETLWEKEKESRSRITLRKREREQERVWWRKESKRKSELMNVSYWIVSSIV